MAYLDLQAAASAGTLRQFPPSALTAAALSARNAAGNTAMHMAAKYGGLQDLPPALVTAELLSLRNDAGYTQSLAFQLRCELLP